MLNRAASRRFPALPNDPDAASPDSGLRRDPLSRFYSNTLVGRIVVDRVSEGAPRTVLDLGSGSGVLAAAASPMWPTARVMTVEAVIGRQAAKRRIGEDDVDAAVAQTRR